MNSADKLFRFCILQICMLFIFCCPALAQDSKISVDKSSKSRPISKACIVFDEREHDFGRISAARDTLKTHTFTFRNTGSKDLFILHAASGCGCTKPIYTKTPVKPGERGTLTVSYRGAGQRSGYFRKSITVYTNEPRSYVRIFICGELVP